jgi:hypothetical protein
MTVQTVLVTGSAARPGGSAASSARAPVSSSVATGGRSRSGPRRRPRRAIGNATTKVLAEAAAHVYAHGLEVFVICCGWGLRSPEQVRELEQSAGLPLGPARYDLGPVRELLGYESRDRCPEDLVTFGGAVRGNPP